MNRKNKNVRLGLASALLCLIEEEMDEPEQTQINGFDVSNIPHEEAVQLFLKAKEPILVEVKRHLTSECEKKINIFENPLAPSLKLLHSSVLNCNDHHKNCINSEKLYHQNESSTSLSSSFINHHNNSSDKSICCNTINKNLKKTYSTDNLLKENINDINYIDKSILELNTTQSAPSITFELQQQQNKPLLTSTANSIQVKLPIFSTSITPMIQSNQTTTTTESIISTSEITDATAILSSVSSAVLHKNECNKNFKNCYHIPITTKNFYNHNIDENDDDIDDINTNISNSIKISNNCDCFQIDCVNKKNVELKQNETTEQFQSQQSSNIVNTAPLKRILNDYDELNACPQHIGYCDQYYGHDDETILNLHRDLEPEINIEEIILKKSRSDEKLGFTISYSSGNGSATNSHVSDDDDDDDDDDDVNDDDIDDLEDFDFDEDTCTDLYISDILPDSLAARDGRLRTGDQILQINGCDVLNKDETESLFNEIRNEVTLLVSRCIYTDDSEFLDSAVYCDDKDITHNVSAASGGQLSLYDCEQNTFSSKSSSISNSENYKIKHNVVTNNLTNQSSNQKEQTIQTTQRLQKNELKQQQKLQIISKIDCCISSSSASNVSCDHANIKAQLESVNKEISLLNSQISNIKIQNNTIQSTEIITTQLPNTEIIKSLESDTLNSSISFDESFHEENISNDDYDNIGTLKPPLQLQRPHTLILKNLNSNNNSFSHKNSHSNENSKKNNKILTQKHSKLTTSTGIIDDKTIASTVITNQSTNQLKINNKYDINQKNLKKKLFTPSQNNIISSQSKDTFESIKESLSFHEIEHVYETIPESEYDTDSFYSSPYENKEKNRIEQWLKNSQKDNNSKITLATKLIPNSNSNNNNNNNNENKKKLISDLQLKEKTIQVNSSDNKSSIPTQENSSSSKQKEKNQKESYLFNNISWNKILCRNNTNDDYENSSSAYNTGGSCNSNQLTFELKQEDRNQSNSTLVFRPIDRQTETIKNCKQCQIHQQQIEQLQQHRNYIKERLYQKHRNKAAFFKPEENFSSQCHHNSISTKLQQKLFRKSLLKGKNLTGSGNQKSNEHNLIENYLKESFTNDMASNQSDTQHQTTINNYIEKNNTNSTINNKHNIQSSNHNKFLNEKTESLSEQQKMESSDHQMVWKVKRRPDGSRYIVRRPIKKNHLLQQIKTKCYNNITDNLQKVLTTEDDDSISETKIGRYWTKDERKRHIKKSKLAKLRQENLFALRIQKRLQQEEQQHLRINNSAGIIIPKNSIGYYVNKSNCTIVDGCSSSGGGAVNSNIIIHEGDSSNKKKDSNAKDLVSIHNNRKKQQWLV